MLRVSRLQALGFAACCVVANIGHADNIVLAQSDNRKGGVIELMNQMDTLNADLNRLRGQIEELNNSVNGAQKRQKDMYLDLDSRLRRFEQDATPENQAKRESRLSDIDARLKRLEQDGAGDFDARLRKLEQQLSGGAATTSPPGGNPATGVAPPTAPTPPTPPVAPNVAKPGPAPAAATTDAVRKVYDSAMNNYKMGDYQGAVAAFDAFVKKYPSDVLSANAQYWIGDSYFNLHDFRSAANAQLTLLKTYPESAKVPDAMLNLGSAYAALNEVASARKTLEDVIAKYPSSEAADKAKQRLAKLPK